MAIVVALAKPSTLLVHASGAVTYEECQRCLDQIVSMQEVGTGTQMLVDAHAVEATPSTLELRAMARDMKPVIERGVKHMAIVTDRQFVYGVVRMFAVFAEVFSLQVNAFRDIASAEEWLDEQRERFGAPGA